MCAQGEGFGEQAVCTLPAGLSADAVTLDGHVIALWPQGDGTLRFTWDGEAGAPFDGIASMRDKTSAAFASPDGRHLAYVGMRGDLLFVGRDGREDPPMGFFSRSVPPVFSRDGRHLAYAGGTMGDPRLVFDGELVGEHTAAPVAAVFSPDGERFAYVEMRRDDRVEARVVLDGVPGEWMPGVRNAGGVMQFSPDSRRFAYCRIDGKLHVQWVVDGVAQQLSDEVRHIGLAQIRRIGVVEPPLIACFSPDSRRFAYFADVPEKGVAVVEDDVPGPRFKGSARSPSARTRDISRTPH